MSVHLTSTESPICILGITIITFASLKIKRLFRCNCSESHILGMYIHTDLAQHLEECQDVNNAL